MGRNETTAAASLFVVVDVDVWSFPFNGRLAVPASSALSDTDDVDTHSAEENI
jgi:hypothetical protein